MAEPMISTLGIVGIKNCGAYDNSTNYEKLNVVTYEGSSYCAKGNTVGHLPTDTDYWDLLAQKGGIGATGATGPQGPKPVKGTDYYTAEDIAELEATLASDVSDEVAEQLGDLTSATPLVASSTSDMTDTTRVYVNTTDDHWYWYNGTSWQDGGVYQATGIDENDPVIKEIIDVLNNIYIDSINIFKSKFTAGASIPTSGTHAGEFLPNSGASYAATEDPIEVEAETQYTISNKNTFSFAINWTVVYYDENDGFLSSYSNGFNTGSLNYGSFTTPENCKYVRFSMRATDLGEEIAQIEYWMLNKGNKASYVPPKQLYIPIEAVGVLNNLGTEQSQFCLENNIVKPYIDNVTYPDDDYSFTSLKQYENVVGFYKFDKPFPVLIKWTPVENVLKQTVIISTVSTQADLDASALQYDVPVGEAKISIYNLLPNKTYYYAVKCLMSDGTEVLLKRSSFVTTNDKVRMIAADGTRNVRDIGGWETTDSHTLKYGMVYRGGEFDDTATGWMITDEGRNALVDYVGIRSDIDLRSTNLTQSPLGGRVEYRSLPIAAYKTALLDAGSKANVVSIFSYLATKLSSNKPVYIHCQGGQDRTGTILYLIEGVCGVTENNLAKEYELTEFSHPSLGSSTQPLISRTYAPFVEMVNYIKTFDGATLKDKIYNCLIDIGVNASDINTIRTALVV